MHTLEDHPHQLALDEFAKVALIEFAEHSEGFVVVRIELAADIFPFEAHESGSCCGRGVDGGGLVGAVLINSHRRKPMRLSPQRGLHPISDSRRQFVRPLVDRLVCDANRYGGSGYGSAEQFDGFRLEHEELNHSSVQCATIVHAVSARLQTMVSTTYAERLARALTLSAALIGEMSADDRNKLKALAKDIGVSYSAVAKLFRDGSNFMNAPNNSKAAKYLRVDSDWLATGDGEMRSERVWPFGDSVSPKDYFGLPDETVALTIGFVVAAVSSAKASSASRKQLATH